MTFPTLIDPVLDELRRALRSVNPDDLDQAKRMVLSAQQVFAAGKGRSGLQMEAFAMRMMHLGLTAHVVGDVTTPGIAPGDVLVIGSGSGRTASLVCHAERAHALQVPVLLMTAAQESPIHAFADCVVRIDAPTPKIDEDQTFRASILPMGSLFEQTLGLLLDLFVLMLMRDLDLDSTQMFSRHANLE